MAAITPLTAIAFSPAEISAAKTANGYEDPVGMMSSILADLNQINMQLNRLSGIIGAGANQTTINNAIAALA